MFCATMLESGIGRYCVSVALLLDARCCSMLIINVVVKGAQLKGGTDKRALRRFFRHLTH